MSNTFDFVNQSQANDMLGYYQQPAYQQPYYQQPQQQMYYNPQYAMEPEIVVTAGDKPMFSTVKEENTPNKMDIKVNSDLPSNAPRRGRPPKKNQEAVNGTEIVRPSSNTEVVEDMPTINTYFETASMLKQSMDQLDVVIYDIKRELDDVRSSRTMKGKYTTIVGLAGNLSDLMQARIGAIKELNNCIGKSNDMDYKRAKDRKEAAASLGTGDEKAVMDLYKALVMDQSLVLGQPGQRIPDAMIQQIQQQIMPQQPASLGIIRSDQQAAPVMAPNFDNLSQDTGYINYMSNMPSTMNALLMEQNPDIKECVVFDASNGAKWFQMMNTKTGQPMPNMQATDQMFMEDTTLDLKNKIAKNVNLGKVYPLVVINDQVTSKY